MDKPHSARSKRGSVPAPQRDILARMPTQDADYLHSIAQVHRIAKNELIFHAGAPGKNVYFLRSGRVKIYQPSPLGKEVILWFCLPGDMFGLAEVAQGEGRVVNAVACETTEVLSVSQVNFAEFMLKHPASSLIIFQVLSCRLRTLSDLIVNLVNDDVKTRITKLIARLSAQYGVRRSQDIQLDIQLTHQEIADMVGTTRQTVTSVFSELQRHGYLRMENRRIRIARPELLQSISMPA